MLSRGHSEDSDIAMNDCAQDMALNKDADKQLDQAAQNGSDDHQNKSHEQNVDPNIDGANGELKE